MQIQWYLEVDSKAIHTAAATAATSAVYTVTCYALALCN